MRAHACMAIHDLGHQRHVDDHPVTLLHAARLQRIGEAANLRMQLPIAQAAGIAGFSPSKKKSKCGLVASLGEVHVEAVPGDVEPAIGEPAIVRGLRLIQGDGEGRLPVQLATREICPETDGILLRVGSAAPRALPRWSCARQMNGAGGSKVRSSSSTDWMFDSAMRDPRKPRFSSGESIPSAPDRAPAWHWTWRCGRHGVERRHRGSFDRA